MDGTFIEYPCTLPEWLGMPIGLLDKNGAPLHVGDRVRFDEKVWGGPHEFIIGFDAGEALYSGGTNEDEYRLLVTPYKKDVAK